MRITPQQRRELMASAQCAEKTLTNWLEKRPMKQTTKERLDAAWERLKSKRTAASKRS